MAKNYLHGYIVRDDDGFYYWEDVNGVVRGEGFSSVQECIADIDEDERYTEKTLAEYSALYAR